jgi:hypothetical protein
MNCSVNQPLFSGLKQLLAGSRVVGMAVQADIAFGCMQSVIEDYPPFPAAAVEQRTRIVGAYRYNQPEQENRHG